MMSLLSPPVSLRLRFSFTDMIRTTTLLITGLLFLPLLGLPQPAAGQSSSPTTIQTNPLAETLTQLATHRSQRDFQTALSRLNTLKKKHPENASVLWRRALILTDLGKKAEEEEVAVSYYRRALTDAKAALKADSTSAWPHAIRALVEGRLCLHVGKRERARRSKRVRHHAKRALAYDSTLALGHHMLGRWHRHVADLNFFERTVADAIYGDLPDASFEQSARALKQALSLQKKSYHHLHLGKTYMKMDREKAAQRQLRKALTASGSPLDPEFKTEARSLLEEID